METIYNKEKKLETALSKLKSLSKSSPSDLGEIKDLYEEKNQLEIEKQAVENKYNELIKEHQNLKIKLKSIEEKNGKNKKAEDEFNQEIRELSDETDSLVEEIEKWQT